MFDIVVKHFYMMTQKSLINKLFFRGRFIGKKIRLLIGRLFNVIAFNFFRLILGITFLLAIIFFMYSLTTYKSNNIAVIAALISSTTAILLSVLPNSKKVNSIMTRYGSPKPANRYGKEYLYQYYVVNISNPNDFSIPLEKIFLTNGDITKNYDVIFINSNNSTPEPQETMDDTSGSTVRYINSRPTDLCILPPKKSILVKFATYKSFTHAYIQSNNKTLYKINISAMNYVAEYDEYRRGIFSNYDNVDYEDFLSKDWIK